LFRVLFQQTNKQTNKCVCSCCTWRASCVAAKQKKMVYACVFCDISLLSVYMCVRMPKFKVHCGSALEPGASGLPHYYTPLVCVLNVIGALRRVSALSVWRQNTKKKPKKGRGADGYCQRCSLKWIHIGMHR